MMDREEVLRLKLNESMPGEVIYLTTDDDLDQISHIFEDLNPGFAFARDAQRHLKFAINVRHLVLLADHLGDESFTEFVESFVLWAKESHAFGVETHHIWEPEMGREVFAEVLTDDQRQLCSGVFRP